MGVDGSGKIRDHPWFAEIDWVKCYQKKLKPSFIPVINDVHCVEYFDEEFTSEEAVNSYAPTK